MRGRRKHILACGGLGAVALAVALWHQREIRIAYHRNRLWAAANNYFLAGQSRPTKFQALKLLCLRISPTKESAAMEQHELALLNLGYLEKRDFWFTNRMVSGAGNAWPELHGQATNIFSPDQWWSARFPASNQVCLTATPADLKRWERMVSEFDQQLPSPGK